MTARHAAELLYDSEAALRLVDSAIEDLREPEPRRGMSADPGRASRFRELLAGSTPLGLVGLSQVLARGYGEIVGALGSLRESRTVLGRTAGGKLQHTHQKLREVSNATETAAADILDGLDRAVALVNEMDARAASGDAHGGADLRAKLRDELFALVGCMQFQDIAKQQLSYASSVLTEMETRLAEVATLLDPTAIGAANSAAANAPDPATFDPAATVENAEARQAEADRIFDKSNG
jgi:hypothetical protein